MTLPGRNDWIFSVKTFAAAMAAFMIAVWIDLPRPYWAMATVYITTQPLAGATRAKALHRLMGTVIGAAASVVLVPAFVNSPEILSLAITLWVCLCLYLSLLDRTASAYLPMLAGYTTAIVGFPSVTAPDAIFDTAVARTEEIGLGILCATLVSTVILPAPTRPVVAARIAACLADARAWIADVLGRVEGAVAVQAKRLRLAADTIAFDAIVSSLRHDEGGEQAAATVSILRQHLLMFLPVATSIADRITALESLQALPSAHGRLLDDLSAWVQSTDVDPASADRLRTRIRAMDPPLGAHPTWTSLLLASLNARLLDFIDLRQDARRLQRYVVKGDGPKGTLAFRYSARARRIRHRDHGMALLSAFGCGVSILLTCAMWIGAGWPDGAAAPMMAAVGCSFFAAQDDPAPFILTFATSAIIGAIGAGIFLFGLLPSATNAEMVILALAPALLIGGAFMPNPRTTLLAMGTVVNGLTSLALTSAYAADLAAFTNSTLALLVAMWTAAIVTRLIRSVGADWSARRLRALNGRSLAEAARRETPGQGVELAALMLDRVGMIAPRLAALPKEDAAWTADLVTEVRVGINLVELRRALPDRTEAERAIADRLLADLAHHYDREAEAPPPALLDDLDDLIARVGERADTIEAPCRPMLLALTGLRRSLFPDAAGPVGPAVTLPLPAGVAA